MFKISSPATMWRQFRESLCPVTLEKLLTSGWRFTGGVSAVAWVILLLAPVTVLAKIAVFLLAVVGTHYTRKLWFSSLRLTAGVSTLEAETLYVLGPLPTNDTE